MRRRSWWPALRAAIRDLSTGYFALVMTTGIVARATSLDGASRLSGFLLRTGIVACVLERAGARPQRPLWASTGVKDPAYDDTRYVTGLVAPSVINTMPEATLNAVADHGDIPADSIHGTYEQSQAVLDDLAALGIGYDDVVQTLEDQGVTAFDASWDHLGQRLATALGTPGR